MAIAVMVADGNRGAGGCAGSPAWFPAGEWIVKRSCLVWLAALLLAGAVQPASASIRAVRPGEVPALAADEGLLVVDVDSSADISSLHIARQGRLLGGETISDIPRGKTRKLFIVTAGDYQWDRIHHSLFFGYYQYNYELGEDKEFRFQVKPGVINYPGDLVYRPIGGLRAIVHASNRGLGAIDWLRENAAGAYQRYRFEFTGHYGDPFPEFYRTARDAQPAKSDAELDKTLTPPEPGKLPIAVEELWRTPRVQQISLNPDGDLLAEAIYENKSWHVDLIDLKADKAIRLANFKAEVSRLDWVGHQVLGVTLSGNSVTTVYIMRIGADGPDGRHSVSFEIPTNGRILDPLSDDPDHLLFESTDSDDVLQVHRLDISGPAAFRQQQFGHGARLNHGLTDAVKWLTDGSGQLRAAYARKGEDLLLYYGTDGKYQPVLKIDHDSAFKPIALSADGSLFYGLSDKGRAQTDLVAFDPLTRNITKTLFSKPGVDVEDPVFDAHRTLVGAAYYQNGQRVVEYFDEDNRIIAQRLAQAFPGLTAYVLDRDDAGKHLIVAVSGSDRPAQLFHLDVAKATASLVDEFAPWLADHHFASSRIIHAKGSDGLPIEAYLTLPINSAAKPPLVVYTHGGPIGIRDSLEFDPAVQFFASLGYAVLQVNYRGSEGYGRAFREAGKHHYGSLIEDDIDAATRVALQQFPLDAERICAVGASYGGYSALVSAIRWPQRFRCAVSISGVSDQILMFTASDFSHTVKDRQALEELIGNPVTDIDAMRTYSPLYRYRELTLPVMLVHGTEDPRVDYEHSRRLVRMLNLAGRPPVMMTLVGEGHGGFSTDNETALWTGVAGFLRAHLGAHPTAAK
jgi:dipeptidyl aminopeptidase/acylaminoacyl peptidase